MDKIFSIINNDRIYDNDFKAVNEFLKENPQYFVKSITPITQRRDGPYCYYGVTIVVSDGGLGLDFPLDNLYPRTTQIPNNEYCTKY